MRIWIVLLTLPLLTVACSRKPKSLKEQMSYTIGAQFGRSLKAQKLDLDHDQVARGIADAMKDDGLVLTDEEMQSAMMKVADQRAQEIKAEGAKNKVEADAFLAKNKDAEGIKVTSSGLQYKFSEEGKGASPKSDDVVVVNYRGTLIDGKEFDSSYKRNMPAEFPVRGVIPGWTEGLQLMKKGGKAMFYIPPELAYGDRPRQNIPANSALIFEVELVDIKKGAAVPGKAPNFIPHGKIPNFKPHGEK